MQHGYAPTDERGPNGSTLMQDKRTEKKLAERGTLLNMSGEIPGLPIYSGEYFIYDSKLGCTSQIHD